MKTILFLLLISANTLLACIDPFDPVCQCTNCPDGTNNYVSPVYTNGELWLSITTSNITLHSPYTNQWHAIYRALAAEGPYSELVKCHTDSAGQFTTNSATEGYYKAMFGFMVTEEVRVEHVLFCDGTDYPAWVAFYGEGALPWNYIDTNSTIHACIDNSGRTLPLTIIGKYGGVWCVTNKFDLGPSPSSPGYRFSFFFPNNIPSNWTVTLQGFNP